MKQNIVLIGSSSELSNEFSESVCKIKNLYGISSKKHNNENFLDHLKVDSYTDQIEEIDKFIKKIEDPTIIFFNGFLAENRNDYFPSNDEINKTIEINYLIPLLITKKVKQNLKIKKFIYISSMAAIVPRNKNYIYGLAKKNLEESIKKITDIEFLIIRYGQIDTKMSSGHKDAPFKLTKNEASKILLKKLEKKGLIYATIQLKLISYILKIIPSKIIDFFEK